MKVYAAINAVIADLAKSGIAKDSRNAQQGYAFRGIDALQNALAPLLAKHALCILPRVMNRQTTERVTKSGGTLFSTVLDVEFDFVHAEDGSMHTVKVIGEGMDSTDKSCNKSMIAAYKYAGFLAFCIPTEASEDADATTPDESIPKPPDGFESWFSTFLAAADKGKKAFAVAWGKGTEDYRLYAGKYRRDQGEAARLRADEVTEQKKAAVQ